MKGVRSLSVFSYLYTFLISPLELLFEVVFSIANRIIGNEGLSIIFLSLAVNFLVLPLYKRADELQAEERNIQAKMASGIKHIKSTFKGDERFFMLQEYYRINHYKPVYALKSTASLLLQIPFFIAAYNLLSGMKSLNGMSFGFIRDLGAEDAMFMIGSFPVNILPILMTLINIISGIIYTKGHPVKEKIQVYGLAAVFLVLLYHSPAGLVFYWLLNNVFSLVKNVFYKFKDPKRVLSIALALSGAALLVATIVKPDLDVRQKILLAIGSLLLCLPFVSGRLKIKPAKKTNETVKDTKGFFAGTVLMAFITGLLIPSSVIASSPYDFIDITASVSPMTYIWNSILLSFGSWVLWGGVFYFFMSAKMKSVFCRAIWIISGCSVINYMLFGKNLGTLSSALLYDRGLSFRLTEYIVNSVAVTAGAVLLYFIYSRFCKITKAVLIVGILSVFSIGVLNIPTILIPYNWYKGTAGNTSEEPSIPLSKNGKNVMVIMLDRSIGTQVPYIFNEKPELLEKYDGFTYYENTISYSSSTITASPALFGGYDYTPEKINARADDSLASKQDEALKVMPVLFGSNGYKVTICDPSLAGYKDIPDLSVFDGLPNTSCYITDGRFGFGSDSEAIGDATMRMNELRNRNLFCYSLMKISPVVLQETLYSGGSYNEALSANDDSASNYNTSPVQYVIGNSISTGYYCEFMDAYSVLTSLPSITEISDGSENTFLMFTNYTAHSSCLLQEPDYVPVMNVDNTAYDVNMVSRYTVDGKTMDMSDYHQVMLYHVNMASFIKLGEWFDYLRENGVYDNTRIIIVADHGFEINQFDISCNGRDLESFMPLLMVKDFNATGFTTSSEFMTNGDTPAIATEGLIDNPINPFTNNPITYNGKQGTQNVIYCRKYDVEDNPGNTFQPGSWYAFLGGDPHDAANWEYLGDY
ncbi:MAG: hypothetical protein E7383_06425 [Ruminococcaceae bacterium]|nr:hypothetical protein [Oscillospiraceae bacterium]